jgi:ClpP class serine protease
MIDNKRLETMSEIFIHKLNNGTIKEYAQLFGKDPEKLPIGVEKVDNGVVVLPIHGTLTAQATMLDAMCGFNSTFDLHDEFNELSNDDSVSTIINHIQSPGGEGTGGFEFADSINNSLKKVISFTDTYMCSLGYLLGAAGDTIVATPTAEVGSIGVRSSIVKFNKDERAEKHIFQSGDIKTFGDPDVPITEKEKQFFQDRVDKLANEFFTAVSVYRDWDIQEIIDTEAASDKAMFLTETKFIDKVMSRDQFLTEVINGLI